MPAHERGDESDEDSPARRDLKEDTNIMSAL
jgi:hypothetical protein